MISKGEELLAMHLKAVGLVNGPKILAEFEREFRFDAKRKWRFDFCWPERKVAVEVDGGTFSGGRHSRGLGYEKDCEKINSAVLQGWRVLRMTSRMVRDGSALQLIEKALEAA